MSDAPLPARMSLPGVLEPAQVREPESFAATRRAGTSKQSEPGAQDSREPVSHTWLGAILLFAFVLRLGFMLALTPVISGDGCEYVRMGMELRDGKPLTGVFDWPETMYGTFYPALIAVVSHLGLSAEHAAKALVLLFGTGLVLAAFFVARHVYSTRVGYFAAMLFAIFPVFIGLGGSVYNETIYMTLWLGGIFFSLRALDYFRPLDFLLAGIFFGCATLSRPEAFAYPIFILGTAALIAIVRKISFTKLLAGAVLLFGSWLLLMVPYAMFQHRHTGQYRFEGKWNINYTLGHRINSGMPYFKAGLGIDDQLHLVGPLLDSSIYAAYTPYPHGFRDKLRYMGSTIYRNWPMTYEEVFAIDFGGPILVTLVVLGLFGAAWNGARLRHEFVLVMMALSIIVLMATAAHIEHRYAYALPVIALLWAAAGLDFFQGWATRTFASWGESLRPYAAEAGKIAVIGASLLLAGFAFVGVRTDRYFTIERAGYLGIKEAGLWLGGQTPKPNRVFGYEGRVTYYANATVIIFPYADPATTLRYLESRNIDYVVLDSEGARYLPTMGQWFQGGIPDARAHLVYESTQGTEDKIKIYRWDSTATAANHMAQVSEAVKE